MSTIKLDPASPDLSADDRAWLRQFLVEARERAPDTLGFEELHGFLFAIVSAPDLVMPSEWIPTVFDSDDAVFRDAAEGERFHRVVMTLYNRISRDIDEATVGLPSCIPLRTPAEANLEPGTPLMLWSRGFSQGHDWLEESWDVDFPEDVDEELGACLSALMFFIDPAFGRALLEESGRPESDLPAFAETLLENFAGAMMGYAEIGRMVCRARQET